MSHSVRFEPSGRGQAQCAPDPAFPNGIALSVGKSGEKACSVALPYPAPECGMWIVRCGECPMSLAITAAGRPDDPISVTFPCERRVD